MFVPGDGEGVLAMEPGAPGVEGAPGVDEYEGLVLAAEQLLDGVDRALASLDDGTYGACEVCGDAVDDRVLDQDPLATRCSMHRIAGELSPGTSPSSSPRRSL